MFNEFRGEPLQMLHKAYPVICSYNLALAYVDPQGKSFPTPPLFACIILFFPLCPLKSLVRLPPCFSLCYLHSCPPFSLPAVKFKQLAEYLSKRATE